MPSRNPKTARYARRVSRRSTTPSTSISSQATSRHTSEDITNSDNTASEPTRRRSRRFTARQDYRQTTDAEDDRMTEEELLADLSRHVIPNIYNVSKADEFGRAKVPARRTVIDLTKTTATAGDARRKRHRAATQESSETVDRPGLVVLKVNAERLSDLLSQSQPKQSSNDHPILRLEALLGELDEEDAREAELLFDSVRRNLERGKDVKGLVDFLTSLFAPVKQRIAGKRARLSDDMAQVEQEMRHFQDASGAKEVIKIED